ncbi:hypothetical protein GA0074695_3224 [Micromonospora viridifaciens]|uniref:Uncharacterized protein n=1 Tax=Micromonospora viridifaciens TaxID=1881 RepID=A0A1C4XEY0_MICVI|nr:hypothetical protein [Micromonospora viridifaciens]SCF06681.1 hypothetical protein GA0074695_3224 [Micromonospora viridifaciens]
MGLTDALARAAVRHARVLLAEVPGHWTTRVAVERQVLVRGWRLARSPAEADILAVCGPSGPDLRRPLARLWEQLPGPRARVEVDSPQAVLVALEAAAANLRDTAAQRVDSRDRPADSQRPDAGHARPGDRAHADHEGTGHAGMALAPAGIPLAAGGPDRDGLDLDRSHLRLGPVLAYWPAGLVLRCTLQGDVIADAETTLVGAAEPAVAAAEPDGLDDLRRFAARRCDNVASLLGLAGWDDATTRARRVRDALLFTAGLDQPVEELDRLRRRVGRSWLLRWSLRRLGPLDAPELARHGLPATLSGDVRDRLLAMLDRAAGSLADRRRPGRPRGVPIEAIPDVVRGWDIATARLIVASLDLDPFAATAEVSHV